MLAHDLLDFAQFIGAESEIAGERDWLQPKLSGQVVSVNMDMRRLMDQIMAVEVESIRPAAQHCGHRGILLAMLATCQL